MLPSLVSAALSRLPSPKPLLAWLDPRLPLALKQRLLEPRLNQQFSQALAEGEFELLEGRFLSLCIRDLGVQLTLTLQDGRLCLADQPGEAVIRGDWRAFLCLALKREDPDGLFFQRRLVIEGDTELGLGIKNLLDGLDWSLDGRWEGRLLQQLEQLAATRTAAA